mgnify:CR=1 FL=1
MPSPSASKPVVVLAEIAKTSLCRDPVGSMLDGNDQARIEEHEGDGCGIGDGFLKPNDLSLQSN